MRLLALSALALAACADEPCPAGSSRGADDLCVLDEDGGAGGTDGSDGADTTDGSDGTSGTGEGVALLGGGAHTLSAVDVSVMADEDDGLVKPRDLAFNPTSAETQLWITDRHDDAMVIIRNPGTDMHSAWRSSGIDRQHWLAQPVALAFGDNGYLATAHDDDGGARDGEDASFLMGPTLWDSDLAAFDGGRPSHLDMVHDPANMGGIAWETGNAYWVHDGYNQCITRMNFNEPHEPGGTWHDDAVVDRYACGLVGYVPDVPAHMVFDHDTGLLWIADPAKGHVASLDPTEWAPDGDVNGTDAAARTVMAGGELRALDAPDLEEPSGLALYDGVLLVSDPATSKILAYSQDGELLDWLDTELPTGALGGLEVGPDGALWVVNRADAQILRIAAP